MARKQALKTNKEGKPNYKPLFGLAVLSLLICGLFFPLLIVAFGQAFFPYQAKGEIVQFNGRNVGSELISQNFVQPVFFHPRNASDSASGVDPHITLQAAYSQIPRIHNATGISATALKNIVDQNAEGTLWIFGSPYVNVLKLNLALVRAYPSAYTDFSRP
jgi:K+-transporting ATPase ATPase C chain